MGGAQTVTVQGDDTLRRTLAAAADDLEHLDQSESARLVQQRAQARAPKRSGTLAASVTAKDLGNGTAVVGSALVYAPVIHNGWAAHNISPQPFLTEALADSTSLVEAVSLRETQHIMAKVRGA
jgi:phage gpG-like protein